MFLTSLYDFPSFISLAISRGNSDTAFNCAPFSIFVLCVLYIMCACTRANGAGVEVRGQRLPHGFQGWNSHPQTCTASPFTH